MRQLAYFVAVADAGTLSEAASRLHVSQPGLSQSLTDLEKRLGGQLAVRRKAHGVTLTPLGIEVLGHARDLLRRAEELEHFAGVGGEVAGTLTVGCYFTLAPTVLPPLLQGFSAEYPRANVEFVDGMQDVLQDRLMSGELDVGIAYDMDLMPEMARETIATVRPYVLLPADHPRAADERVSIADLVAEPQILLDAPPSLHNTLAILERFGMAPTVRHRTMSFELTRSLVGRGLGWALLVQRPAIDRSYEGKRVVVKEIKEPVGTARIVVVWPKTMALRRAARAFVDHCRDHPLTGDPEPA